MPRDHASDLWASSSPSLDQPAHMTIPDQELGSAAAKRAADVKDVARVIVSLCLLLISGVVLLGPDVPDRVALASTIVGVVAGYWLRH
jgi:hypothetical protein